MALGPALDPDAAAYIAAVEAADGQALEDGVKDAINDFVIGCKADGIWDAIKSSAILAGARTLDGALVPLVGTAPTNNNFVSGDYNRVTGLVGNGSTKYLDSGVSPADVTLQNSAHLSVYTSSAPEISLAGSLVTSPNSFLWVRGDGNFASNSSGSVNSGLTPGAGFQGTSRLSSTQIVSRANGASVTSSSSSAVPNSAKITLFVRNLNGTPGEYSDSRMAFYSIGESLDLALLDTRVSQLMTDIDAAIDLLYDAAGSYPVLDLKLAENGNFTDAISGDDLVTFSRSAASSPGTYVGSDGLIKTASVNSVLYSGNFSITPWSSTPNTGTITHAQPDPFGGNGATKLVRSLGQTSWMYVSQYFGVFKTGLISLYAKDDGYGRVTPINASGGFIFATKTFQGAAYAGWNYQELPGGWFRLYGPVTASSFLCGISPGGDPGDGVSGVYVFGMQFQENETELSPYIPTTSQALAAARFDHDPATGESLGLLVEEARTNLWTYSGDPDSLSWGLFGVTRRTTSPIAAPDGTSISTVFDFSAAPGRAIEKSIAVSGNNTVSAYLRTESGTETMYFTLNNGSNIYSQPFTVTDEWQRFSFTLDTTGGTGVVAIRNGAAGGAKSVYAWGVQYEAGASPTSYIPTTSAAMTRAADIATIEGADFASWYNSTDGTGYGEFDRENPGSSPVQVLFHFAGPVGRFALYEHQPALAASAFYNLGVSACPVGTFCKHAGAFSSGGSGTESSAFDGVVVVGEAGTVNPDINKIYIGSRPTGQQLNGHIKRLTYWDTRLPDANLGAITS